MKRKQRSWEERSGGSLGRLDGADSTAVELIGMLAGHKQEKQAGAADGLVASPEGVKDDWHGLLDKDWNNMFQLLQEYKATTGSTTISKSTVFRGQSLGSWLDRQRILRRNDLIKADRKARLDDLGVFLRTRSQPISLFSSSNQAIQELGPKRSIPNKIEPLHPTDLRGIPCPDLISSNQDDSKIENWETMFERLKEYKREHGDCRVPTKYSKECEGLPSKLGNWVLVQSRDALAKARKGDPVYVERKQRLDSIGFQWEGALDCRWDDMFERLRRFYNMHGHCRVPSNYNDGEKGPCLGYWVRRQQTDIPSRAESGKRSAIERKRRLDAIDFEWNRVFDAKWHAMFESLKLFKKEHGHCRVPLSYTCASGQTNLGRWCQEQRKNIPEKLEGNDSSYEERRQQLDAIGFEWKLESEKERRWNMMFERLEHFKRKHGHCRVPKTHKVEADGANLAFWVRNQQEKVPKRAIDGNPVYIERQKRLDSIGFEWTSVHTEQWETMFKRLLEYKEEHGNTRVPYRKPNDGEEPESQTMLGIWVYAQRSKLPSKAKSGDELSIERKQRLDKIGFEWNSVLASKWDIMFNGLKRFKKEFGHCRVPRTYKDTTQSLPGNLGSWVITQRRTISIKAESGDELSIARKLCLDSLGFQWTRTKALKP